MGKKIIFILLAFILLLAMPGCKKKTQFSYEKIRFEDMDKKIAEQIDTNFFKNNGVYMIYLNNNKDLYLFLNRSNISESGEVLEFSDVKIDTEGDTIKISLNESSDKQSSDKKYEWKLLYRINRDKEYDTIRVFINGKESHFDGVGAF